MLDVHGLLEQQDRQKIGRLPVRLIRASKDADERLFEDPKLYRQLKGVTLNSNRNGLLLKAAALNYPDLKMLTVVQKEPLCNVDLSSLMKFRHLEYLELNCPSESPGRLLNALPPSLLKLQLRNSNVTSVAELTNVILPHLLELTVFFENVTSPFWQGVCAPRLRTLVFFRVKVGGGVFHEISKFAALRDLQLSYSDYDEAELFALADNPQLVVRVQNEKQRELTPIKVNH